MARLLFVAALAFLAAACGGDEPTDDDAATVQVMLGTSANVQRAVQPLYMCMPENAACYRRAGPGLVAVVDQARTATDTVLAETDDACLREFAALYRDSLDAYGDAGRAAKAGDAAAVEAAISETTRLEIAYGGKLEECGFVEGRLAEWSSALRKADLAMLRLDQEFTACADEACVLDIAARGEKAAGDAIAAVDGALDEIGDANEDVPPCFPPALRKMRQAYEAVQAGMRAIGELDVDAALRESTRGTELGAQAQEDMAACIGSASL